jgi:hypothetical protein
MADYSLDLATQRNPMCVVPVSIICGRPTAGR